MSSDLGTNPNRIDIKLDADGSAIDSIDKIIAEIEKGATVIMASLDVDLEDCYDNELSEALRAIGIEDLRFGTMSHLLGGGVGYTLYKGKKVKGYDKIGDRGSYNYSNSLGEIVHLVEKTLVDNLEKYGVESAGLDYGNFQETSSSIPVTVTLRMRGEDKAKRVVKFDQHVDVSSFDEYETLLQAYASASDKELAALDEALNEHQLSDLEPELFNYMAQEYALRSLPDEYNGGEWTPADEEFYVQKADLKKI